MDDLSFKQMDIDKGNYSSSMEIENLYGDYNTNYPAQLMDANNIPFHVLNNVVSFIKNGNNIDFQIETKKFINRHFWTHETMMNCLYEDKESNMGRAYLRITLYDDSVFRVHYNNGEIYGGEIDLESLPTHMLIGKPKEKLQIQITENKENIIINTNRINIKVSKSPFSICALNKDNEIVFRQKGYETWISDSLRTSFAEINNRHVFYESLMLCPDEKIFGLGERFDHVERTGICTDFWNKDAIGTTSTRTYINIPFYWSTRGYGLLLNTYGRKEWEVGTRDSSVLSFGTDDEYMDYVVICEPNPKDILKQYANLTGNAAMPPIWSFGLWMSRNSYMSWDVVDDVIKDMSQKNIPFDVIHLDTAWFHEDWNCDLKFSKERFSQPAKRIGELKDKGIRVSLWQYNFIPNRLDNDNLKTAIECGYLVKGHDGKPYKMPEYVTGSWTDDAIIDFSNPDATKWYTDQIVDLISMGVGAIKTDFGEGVPENAIYKNIDSRYFHNYYSLVYNHVMFEAIRNTDPETLVWARSGTAGSQRYPVHWGGDSQCTWGGLAGTLRGLISASMSGIIFYSHDIGGFIGRPTPELYIRWAQLGLFSSHSRCHGAGNQNSREPSSFGQEAVEIFKKYAMLRYRLLPYIINQAEKTIEKGLPFTRGLALEFPEDRGTIIIEDEYMMGEDILVAPVVMPKEVSQTRNIYLPNHKTRWVDFYTGMIVQSGYLNVESQLELLPLYVKSDAVIPYGPSRMRTHNTIDHISEIQIYPDFEGIWDYCCDGTIIKLIVENKKIINIEHNQTITPIINFV